MSDPTDNEPDIERHQFATEFNVSGDQLDVDRLSALLVAPRDILSMWKPGDATESGVATFANLTIRVFRGGPRTEFEHAVRRFLDEESVFITQAGEERMARAGLSTTVYVASGHLPVGVALPSDLLARFAGGGLTWSVLAVPCTVDGAIAVGDKRSST